MLAYVGALDFDFKRRDMLACRDIDPRIASYSKGVHRVRNYRSPNTKVILRDRIGDAIAHIVDGVTHHTWALSRGSALAGFPNRALASYQVLPTTT
jgi:hypothetical protein